MAGTSALSPAAATVLAAARPRFPAGRYVVALSGGADSAVAAWAATLSAGIDDLRAVHVHHDLEASDELAEAARAIADQLDVPLTQVDVVVPAGASFEGRAREVRLAALREAAGDADWIATGHHADDSVETVVSHLLRGAGAAGLAGISPVRGRWVRPLIDVERETIRTAASELGLPYLDDPANADPRHQRNLIRSVVLPSLEELFGRPVAPVITRSAASLAEDDAALRAEAERVPIRLSAGAVVLPAVVLSTVAPAIAARAAREALRLAHPPYPGTAADVAAVLSVAEERAHRVTLSGGLQADREGPLVAIHAGVSRAGVESPLAPGETVEYGPWRLHMSTPGEPRSPVVGRSRAPLLTSVLTGGVVVRSAAEGERIDIDGGTKTVRDAMAEAGVPARLRPAWPVVAVDGKIAWVAGVRAAGWARQRDASEAAVELSVEGIGV